MLETAVAILYFINKILLSLNKKAGWQIGILASILAFFYFLSLKLYLLVGLELSFLSILVFGLINHGKELKFKNLLYGLMFFIMVFLYFILKNSTLIEFIISVCFILAIYFLANRNTLAGWIIMLIGHLLMGYFTFTKNQYIFASLQLLSCFVSIYAILNYQKAQSLKNKSHSLIP
jgi:hypothetical protein